MSEESKQCRYDRSFHRKKLVYFCGRKFWESLKCKKLAMVRCSLENLYKNIPIKQRLNRFLLILPHKQLHTPIFTEHSARNHSFMALQGAPNVGATKHSCSPQRAIVHFSMCIFLFAWPLYRASRITTNITADDSERAKSNDSFLPNNVEMAKQVPCGQYKCFFWSKYLVAPSIRKKDTDLQWFETLESGWNLAEELKDENGIQHLLLEPPMKLKVSKQLARCLNKNLFSEKKQNKIRGKKAKRFPKGSTVFVQKVQAAPKNSIVVGCTDTNMDSFKQRMKDFAKTIKNIGFFSRNFKQGLATARELLENEVCMTKDFQVECWWIQTGLTFYHLDFDRCFMPDDPKTKYEISREETKSCHKVLNEIDRRFERNLARQER